MKKIYFLFALVISYLSFAKEIQKDTLPNLERRIYAIQLNIPGPFELYVNDFPARIENVESMHNTAIEINRYILKSGKYKFRLRVLPSAEDIKAGGIQPATASRIRAGLIAFERNTEKFPHSKKGSYKKILDFTIPKIDKRVPYLEITGEFEVELPYNLEGWSNSEDLSKIDKKELEDQVTLYYQQLRIILNNGDGVQYLKKYEKYQGELLQCEYTLPLSLTEANNTLLSNISNYAKGNMEKLEKFNLKIYGQGRLVRLERGPTIEMNNKKMNIKGWSPLLRNGSLRGVSDFPIMLHKPKGSETFEIIRIW